MLFSVPLPVAWKKLTVLDSLNFIFPLWEPHSRIIFLSQTNELQRVHYAAAPKQEAGVSDGKSWFYIMRDAWGCTYRRCIAGRTQQGLFLPILGLCSASTAAPSDLDDQAPFPGEVPALTFGKGSTCRRTALTFLCFENWHSHGDGFQVYSLPTYPLSIVPLGWRCLGGQHVGGLNHRGKAQRPFMNTTRRRREPVQGSRCE